MTNKTRLLLLSICLWTIGGCSKPDDSNNDEAHTYTPLRQGNVRQVMYVHDSSTVRMQEIAPVRRSDGVEVTPMLWFYGTQAPDTLYYYIKDGFFTGTALSASGESANPFFEQRIGKAQPVDGDSWKSIPADPGSNEFVARFFSERATAIGSFKNVFGFVAVFRGTAKTDTLMTPLYALDIGYIGTDLPAAYGWELRLTYIKTATVEMGHPAPARDPGTGSRLSKTAARRIIEYSLFGMRR